MVHNSRKQSSRLLITASVLCSSSGASKNGNIAAPINEYNTTRTQRPGVENKMRNVKCIQRFVWITFAVSSASTTISPSLFSICDILMNQIPQLTEFSLHFQRKIESIDWFDLRNTLTQPYHNVFFSVLRTTHFLIS